MATVVMEGMGVRRTRTQVRATTPLSPRTEQLREDGRRALQPHLVEQGRNQDVSVPSEPVAGWGDGRVC